MFLTWLSCGKHHARQATPRSQRRVRPRLEALEDRLTPATFKVTTFADVVDPADRKLSLREAITRANDLSGPDTIVLQAGVYKIALDPTPSQPNEDGDFAVTDSVRIQGAGAGRTIIDAQQKDRVFRVVGTVPSSIKVVFQELAIRNGMSNAVGGAGILVSNADLVIKDCLFTGNHASEHGGGISNALAPGTGNLTLIRTTVSRNVGSDGGGIYFVGNTPNSLLKIVGSTIQGNRADDDGGGITAQAALVIRSTIRGNTAAGQGGGVAASTITLLKSSVRGNNSGGDGGGISANTVTLVRSTVSGNTSAVAGGGISAVNTTIVNSLVSNNAVTNKDAFGGGIFTNTAILLGSTVSRNTADGSGGGIFADAEITLTNSTVHDNQAGGQGGGIRSLVTVTLTGSTLSGNQAGESGGAINAGGAATLTNCTISGNQALQGGGLLLAADASLLNVTITRNSASAGGGVFRASGVVRLKNTIVAGNRVDAAGHSPDLVGAFQSEGHNLIGDPGATGFVNGIAGDRVGASAKPLNPKLGKLADNGGRTMTHALLPGSPAIDHGDNTDAPTRDQRGVRRPRDGGGNKSRIVDIGAFER